MNRARRNPIAPAATTTADTKPRTQTSGLLPPHPLLKLLPTPTPEEKALRCVFRPTRPRVPAAPDRRFRSTRAPIGAKRRGRPRRSEATHG
jgi:hypothetical protein